jgi:hypothetical protein
MPATPADWQDADAFDLPEWLLGRSFGWQADESLTGVLVRGHLAGEAGRTLPLDLLCADVAFPEPVVPEELRTRVHQAWHYDQVLLVVGEGRHSLALPVPALGPELVCEAMRRFAKAVGVRAEQASVTLRL